ncbi:MAG TPA: hypothetical protein VFS12_11490 [Terriglobia bacterium]|nr:hypothetical protein [Terriglobia bacterium]
MNASPILARKTTSLKCLLWMLLCGASPLPLLGFQNPGSQQAQAEPHSFGGTFKTLQPAQQRLIVEWVRRFNSTAKQNVDAEKAYDAARLSLRTTFDAITHALMNTKLTSKDGRSLGTALDLIDILEDIAGEEQGTRGDRQFRVYVYLKPNALKTFEESQEFKRERDNTHYHMGFPICYRLLAGPPSIQYSLARDGKRADIDVDYRSSSFPAALVNGHLSSDNSDVRAGENLEKHDGRWSGLSGWWQNLFGLLNTSDKGQRPAETYSETAVPPNPRISEKEGVDQAVHDFLSSWLLEQKPNLAASYFSRRSYPCLAARAQEKGRPVEAGMVRTRLLMAMASVNKAVGKPTKLEEVVENVKSWSPPRLKPVKNAYEPEFSLFAVPDDIAAARDCTERYASELIDLAKQKKPSQKYGDYFASAFRAKAGPGKGNTIYFLWTKEDKHWKIVALKVADEADPRVIPTAAAAPTKAETNQERVQGDSKVVEATQKFLSTWLLKQDYNAAVSYLSPRSYVCLERSDDPTKKGLTPEQARKALHDALQKTSGAVGRPKRLEEAIRPIDPHHDLLKPVGHSQEKAFSLVSVPDGIAEAEVCGSPKPSSSPAQRNNTYGHYYGAAFQLKVPGQGEEPAGLYTLWGLEDGRWTVIAWEVIAN